MAAAIEQPEACSQLHLLDLRDGSIGVDGFRAIGQSLKDSPIRLKCLGLRGNNLKDEGVGLLADLIALHSSLSTLDFLDLGRNDIRPAGIRLLVNALKSLERTPPVVDFDWNILGPEGTETFAELIRMPGVSSLFVALDLSGNGMRKAGSRALCQALEEAKYWPRLHLLDLSVNLLGAEGTRPLVNALAVCSLPALESIELEMNEMGPQGACSLAGILQDPCRFRNLGSLHLRRNSIGPKGVRALTCALESRAFLGKFHTLDLSSNNIGDEGITALAACRKLLQGLGFLRLNDNDISDKGLMVLSSVLQDGASPRLRVLHLCYNLIGPKGVSALAQSLQWLPLLETLNITGNVIGLQGCEAVALAFQHCHKLQWLYMDGDEIGAQGARVLSKGLRLPACPKLSFLHVNSEAIGAEGRRLLGDALGERGAPLYVLNYYNRSGGFATGATGLGPRVSLKLFMMMIVAVAVLGICGFISSLKGRQCR